MKKRFPLSPLTRSQPWRWLGLLALGLLPLAGQAQQGAPATDPTISVGAHPAQPLRRAATPAPAARTTGTWTTMAAMSSTRVEPGAGAVGGKIYVWGGYQSSVSVALATAEAYTISTNTWAAIASLPITVCGPATAVGTDGNLYSFGGRNASGYLGSSYKYTVATNTWTSIAAMPVIRWEARALTAPDGRIFVFGGWNYALTLPVGTDVQIYTPSTNTWSTGTAMPTAIFGSGAGIDAAGLLHLYGGIDANQNPSTAHIAYNVTTNAWTTATATPTPGRAYTTGTTGADGNLYLFGGANSIAANGGTTYSQVDYYSPTTSTWSSGPALPSTLSEAASVVAGNYLYVVGGLAAISSPQSTLYRLDAVGTPTITTSALSAAAYCAGSALTVSFTASGTFTAGNVFTAQLSNASGSFTTPTTIGTLTGTASGSIAATLPAGTTGTGFRVRVVSSTPAITGSDNGTNITITAPPVATFSYGAASSFCTTQTTAQAVVLGTGATAGTFTVAPATGLTLAANNAITPSTSTPGTYTVTNTVAASGGCAAATATSTVTITAPQAGTFAYPAPTATGAYCAGSPALLTPTLVAGAVGGTFALTSGTSTGATVNATTGALNLSAASAGTFTVTNTVAAAGACAATVASQAITVLPLPTAPTLTTSGTPATGITLTAAPTTGYTFLFYRNGVLVPGTTGNTYLVNSGTANGSYTVVAVNSSGCQSPTSAAVLVTVTATSAAQAAGVSLELYPNPAAASGSVVAELQGWSQPATLTLLNALGQVVRTVSDKATGATRVDLGNLAPGVYWLRAQASGQQLTQRLVIN